ncbi:MAG: hypothetical protein HOV80_21155 [Polyangiaceae bacterium]|nr:hypothetical protein [Polyangiaceae bacterium]
MGVSTTRRELLAGGLRALTVLPAAMVFGCGGNVTCDDTSGLSPEEAKARTDQNYLDTGPDPVKHCELCAQWVAPAQAGCGGCKVLKGSISPKGSCNLFAKA